MHFLLVKVRLLATQEFRFNPRPTAEASVDKSRITGEGRVEGRTITGSAWTSKDNVTGTEGHIAAERNPSERQGRSHAFANSKLFKDKGSNPEPTHHVTGMVGWSSEASAPITVVWWSAGLTLLRLLMIESVQIREKNMGKNVYGRSQFCASLQGSDRTELIQ